MITLNKETVELIRIEMESIPLKYQKPFNSAHEGLAVLREEYVELENEIFFGEKKCLRKAYDDFINPVLAKDTADFNHKENIRKESIQVAAMACRIIQELTY